MKTRITLLLTLALIVISVNAFAQKKAKKANFEEVTFVTSIDCKNCAKKCNATLPYEKGIKDCKVDLPTKTIYFKFDPSKTSKDKLAKAIERLGYTAEEVETVKKAD
ncbi:MAG: heavy-metal-associated domain-containing protein [Bacteroidales bacterium]|nr:heavy-metal-associated domain-containing protein [Bacteroidales bacterium]